MKLAAACALLATGCAKLLGLDATSFDQRDAPTDSPGACDGLPAACVATTGRTICGQLRGTGSALGSPLRAPGASGAVCAGGLAGGDGPCAFTVVGLPAAKYFAGDATGAAMGTIDDCGRFAIPNTDPMVTDVAVVFDATGYEGAASLVIGRPATTGIDAIDGYPVTPATAMAWSTAVGADASTGYLVRYTADMLPLAGDQVAHDGSSALTSPPGTLPWAAYFSDELGTLDKTLIATAAPGLAFALISTTATFELDGFRVGRRCRVKGLRQVPNALIYVVATNC